MKTIGLIGGMSWESTVTYYQIINCTIQRQLGGLHSAQCILYSVDFNDIEHYQHQGDWFKAGEILTQAAQKLELAGADYIVICTNTMHKVANQITDKITIPLLHIADVTAEALVGEQMTKIALLGTQYTMEQNFYRGHLEAKGITVMVPDSDDRAYINHTIYKELCLGVLNPMAKKRFLAIIDSLHAQGAQAIVLGCTEIGLLIRQSDTAVPLFDTTKLHARAAALKAI